jgi:hypothetical protein
MSSDMAASFTHPKNKKKKEKTHLKKQLNAKCGTMWCHSLRYHQYACAFEGINYFFLGNKLYLGKFCCVVNSLNFEFQGVSD